MPTINRQSSKRLKIKNEKRTYEQIRWEKFYAMYRPLREEHIRDHPLDELDLLEDKVTPAELVHHIIPISCGRQKKQLEWLAMERDNLISLSKENHVKVHKHRDQLTAKQVAYLNDRVLKVNDKYRQYRGEIETASLTVKDINYR